MNRNGRIPRRQLLHGAAIAPLGITMAAGANSPVTVGVIGVGGRGRLDAKLLQEATDARVTAVCDLEPSRMDRVRTEIPLADAKFFEDYRELLTSDVDAVIIATPVFLHPEHMEAALKAGKHVYIEKPAAVDVEGCRRVMRAADAADRRLNLSFGFQQRYGPGYRRAKTLLDSGGAGELRLAHSYWVKGAITGKERQVPKPQTLAERSRNWKAWRETFGDYIVETYCHGIDVLNWYLGGHPNSAIGSGGRTVLRRGDMLDHVDVTFHYPGGVNGMLTGTQLAPQFYRDVREVFLCSEGVIETARHYWTHHQGKGDAVTENEPRDITADALAEFIQRIRTGNPENTGVRSAESTLTAIMGRMAIDQKREVTWEEVMRS